MSAGRRSTGGRRNGLQDKLVFVKMDNTNFEFERHVSIDHRSSSVASVHYSANLNLRQYYNLNLH